MPQYTTNLNLEQFDLVNDRFELFKDFRNAIAGTNASNMQIIDTAVGTKATTQNYTATIPSTSWTGAVAPFTKVVAVVGILETDNPIWGYVPTGVYAIDLIIKENSGLILEIETSNDSITVTTTEVPTADIPVIFKVVR